MVFPTLHIIARNVYSVNKESIIKSFKIPRNNLWTGFQQHSAFVVLSIFQFRYIMGVFNCTSWVKAINTLKAKSTKNTERVLNLFARTATSFKLKFISGLIKNWRDIPLTIKGHGPTGNFELLRKEQPWCTVHFFFFNTLFLYFPCC